MSDVPESRAQSRESAVIAPPYGKCRVTSALIVPRYEKSREPVLITPPQQKSRVTTLVINLSITGKEPSVFGKNRSSLRKEPSVFGIERRSGAPWRQTRIGFNKMNRGHNVFLYWTMLSNYNLFAL